MTGKDYHLLSEAQWEYAARGGTKTRYYWGDEIGNENANCVECGSKWDNRETSPVGSFKPNPFGINDMAGNVWQWVEDCFHANYDKAPADGSAWTVGTCDYRVVRGGSWGNYSRYLRSAGRLKLTPANRDNILGFRVARALAL